MRRRPQSGEEPALESPPKKDGPHNSRPIGLILSGGGSRAAYQVGALRALESHIASLNSPISVVIGSSIGAVNGILIAAGLKHSLSQAVSSIEAVWAERTFRNSFRGSPSMAFLRSVKMAILKYSRDPGPHATDEAIFDPTPLMERVDQAIADFGGLSLANRAAELSHVAVMTTIEGKERKPLIFSSSKEKISEEYMRGASFEIHNVDTLSAKHAFASAALPSVLPPVELDVEGSKIKLVDGGISQNVPVDPAVRMGAERVIVIDISGRNWWLDRYGEAHDTRPEWEVPAAAETFCFRPPETLVLRPQKPLGPVLKQSVGGSTRTFIEALGPTWPIFSLIKKRLGEELAYEVLSYVALHPDYLRGLIERGYNETIAYLRTKSGVGFTQIDDYKAWIESEFAGTKK